MQKKIVSANQQKYKFKNNNLKIYLCLIFINNYNNIQECD